MNGVIEILLDQDAKPFSNVYYWPQFSLYIVIIKKIFKLLKEICSTDTYNN